MSTTIEKSPTLSLEDVGLRKMYTSTDKTKYENQILYNYEHSYRIAVYGTLLPGEHNYVWMASSPYAVRDIDNDYTKVHGLTMRSLGGYPGASLSSKDNFIDVKTMLVSKQSFRHVHAMEQAAGYTPYYITINGKICVIYIYPPTTNEVETFSNWIAFKESKKKPLKTPTVMSEEQVNTRTRERGEVTAEALRREGIPATNSDARLRENPELPI